MECGCSFVEIESEKLTVLAQRCISDIKKHREHEIALIIQQYRGKINKSWWFKIFKKNRPTTDEEIKQYIHKLHSNQYGPTWDDPLIEWQWCRNDDEKVAQRLLTAAKYSDKIMVSVNDLSKIT